MIVSHDLQFIFVHVHRTGGTSLSNLLKHELKQNFEELPQHENIKTLQPDFLEKYSNYYVFGFVRNPWTRILSWYSLIHFNDPKSIKEERIRFEHFLKTDAASDFTTSFFHYNSLDYFTEENGELKVDEIFQFEKMDTAVQSLLRRFNLKSTTYPNLNATQSKNYKDYYTDESFQLIKDKCKKDIDFFHYRF